MLMLSFSISFVYLVVIPLIFCVTPLWHAATAHSPSGKALNSSSQEDPITPWHTNSTLSCVISLRNSATAHSPSSKELKPSSLEEWCLSGLIALLMLSYYPACALGLSLVWYSLLYLLNPRPPFSKIFHSMWGLFLISVAKEFYFTEQCSLKLWWS